ncbi:mCG147170 [Mus musculus]|nr:mCG147170 [Mus musculus]
MTTRSCFSFPVTLKESKEVSLPVSCSRLKDPLKPLYS